LKKNNLLYKIMKIN